MWLLVGLVAVVFIVATVAGVLGMKYPHSVRQRDRETQPMETAEEREAARAAAIADGKDPDEIVSYGPAYITAGGDAVEREAPIWVFYGDAAKARLP